jgi:D-alanine-D-alanine ligase
MNKKSLKNLDILVVAGGWSNERQVSLLSGNNVFQCLKKNNFRVKFLDLDKRNINFIFKLKPDLIFNALHGEFGEDGSLSYLADKNKIAITHSNDLTSALCFNKRLLKYYLKNKLNTLSPKEINLDKKPKFPIISKPNWGGSSKGILFINDFKGLKSIMHRDEILNEEVIVGKELTVTVIKDDKKLKALGVTEIEFNSYHYDYQAKYTKGKSKHYLPARISNEQYKFLINISKKIFSICKCRSLARLDFILNKKNGKIYFLELNTHPGLTKISLVPEQAKFNNFTYLNLLEKIIISSL